MPADRLSALIEIAHSARSGPKGREVPPASQTMSPGGVSVTERRTGGHNETPQCRGVHELIRLRGVVQSHDRCTDQGGARRSGTVDQIPTVFPRSGRAVR